MADADPAWPVAGPRLSGRVPELLLAVVAGVSVANPFYVQSLLPEIAADLGLAPGTVLLAPMVIQAGLAASLLLVLPIGDLQDRRDLLVKAALGTGAAALAVGLVGDFRLLLLAWFCLGLFALVPYLLTTYVSALVPEASRGRTLGRILSGQFAGILLSRSVSGVVGEHLGWRTIFLLSGVLMVGIAWWIRARLPRQRPQTQLSYGALQASQLRLLRRHPVLRQACLSQALQFGTFMGVWSALALHLAAPPWDLGPATIGAFGLVGGVSIAAAPVIGRLVDRYGAWQVVLGATVSSLLGVLLLLVAGGSLAGIALGLALLDLGVQGSLVANQTRVFGLDPDARSRMACLLFFSAYLGAAVTSALVSRFWAAWNWQGVALLGGLLVLAALASQFPAPRETGRG